MYQCNQTLLMCIRGKTNGYMFPINVGNTRLRGYKPITSYKGGLR